MKNRRQNKYNYIRVHGYDIILKTS